MSGENCDQYVAPSPDLMKTVLTPAAFAFAAIASRSPPSDLFRDQIHMPEPSKGVPLGLGAVGGGGGLTTWIGPNVFERRPSLSTTRMRPEPAAGGTTTTRPARLPRTFELMSFLRFDLRGNSTICPRVSPLPVRTSLPPGA